MTTWSQQPLKGDLRGQRWGSNYFFQAGCPIQLRVTGGAGRLERKPQINTEILRLPHHYLSLFLSFFKSLSPSVYNPLSFLSCWQALFCLPFHFALLCIFCYRHMKISSFSQQHGLSRKSTLLTLLLLCTGELVVSRRYGSWWRSLRFQKGQCLWEGRISCFYSPKVIKLPLGLHLEPRQ